jgi:hypothetical protein
MYLTIRALHVLCAGTWLGMVVFAVFWLNPMMHDFGPDAGKIGASLEKHRFMMAIPSISGITVLTGFYLFWRFTGAFSPDVMHSTSAMVFGTGGLLGFIALMIGALVVGRSMKRVIQLGGQAATASEGDRRRLVGEMTALRHRAEVGTHVVLGLLAITTVLMAIGHYV